jgi:hypothetical protein
LRIRMDITLTTLSRMPFPCGRSSPVRSSMLL